MRHTKLRLPIVHVGRLLQKLELLWEHASLAQHLVLIMSGVAWHNERSSIGLQGCRGRSVLLQTSPAAGAGEGTPLRARLLLLVQRRALARLQVVHVVLQPADLVRELARARLRRARALARRLRMAIFFACTSLLHI
jgi:hypothetical protein